MNDLIGTARNHDAVDPFKSILGESPCLQRAKVTAQRLAGCRRVPILITGETGVGKELFARAIHDIAFGQDAPFVAINCGALSKDLLNSELFGYADGAFTGAKRSGNVGKLEAANGGTLFLDEFGELPLDMQPALLRVLESGEYYRVGENIPRKTNFRLLTATNKDLEAEASDGKFRSDLYYRIAVATLPLPPLRDRGLDLEILINHFLTQTSQEYGLPQRNLEKRTLALLRAYSWPGNVRELRNILIGVSLAVDATSIRCTHLPQCIKREIGEDHVSLVASTNGLQELERTAIVKAMESTRGNLTRAANVLGLPKSTLHYKLKRHGINRKTVLAQFA